MPGILYMCATPIGNLEDMSYRAIKTLKEVDLIAAEDTRNSIKLLNYFEIKTPMTSYHEFNKYEKADYLIKKIADGCNIAVITDAGTPGISDPGEELVKKARLAGIQVTSIPGPAAFVNALIISGQSSRRFVFEAFLPTDKKEKRKVLESLKTETRTIIIYEAPHRLRKTLEDLYDKLGERRISICKELTKKHENILQITFSEAIKYYQNHDPRGEYVLVIDGCSEQELEEQSIRRWDGVSLEDHMKFYGEQGMDKKDAMKSVAADLGVTKREIYQRLLNDKEK